MRLCVDRESAAHHLVNSLRGAMTPHLEDPVWTGFVTGLREASAEFDELWSHHDVTAQAIAAKVFRSEAAPERPGGPARLAAQPGGVIRCGGPEGCTSACASPRQAAPRAAAA
ncbi:hypothetical protein [Aeromicrobium ginsengisoli]|uniref:MmyB family transcriptional regulator n=1 Tax=Aeromicrobium ginsengisoli TaxID=363867 RepID=UPI00165F9D6E